MKEKTHKIEVTLFISFTCMTLVIVAIVTSLLTVRFRSTVKKHAVELTNEVTNQMSNNVDRYFNTVETNVNMIFSDARDYTYDPTNTDLSEYDALELREEISSDLQMLSFSHNYTDFAFIYRDGSNIGNLSEGTKKNYQENLYEEMENSLSHNPSKWLIGYGKDYSKLYYIRRINDNGILLASVYLKEVTDLLETTTEIDDMSIYLTSKSGVVLFSSNGVEEPGKLINNRIRMRIVENGGTRLDRSFLVSSAKTKSEMYIVNVIPTDSLLSTMTDLITYVVIVAVILVILSTMFILYVCRRAIASVNNTLGSLDKKAQIDLLTGILNKKSFEEMVSEVLGSPDPTCCYALVFMDVDNFKSVNDKCGHDIGDLVLKSFARTLYRVFREEDLKGRIGGDEFCVFMKMTKESKEDVLEHVNSACFRFKTALQDYGESGHQSTPIVTSSMGVAIASEEDTSFESLYHKADQALYVSKKRGKNTWTIYGEEVQADEET